MQKGKILAVATALCTILSFLTFAAVHAQGDETDEGRIYYSLSNTIVRAKLDGSDPETLLTGLPLRDPEFSADGTMMYGIGGDDVIRRANVDGSGLTEILAPGNDPINLTIDNAESKLYWMDDFSVRRANLDGSGIETLVVSQTNPIGLRLDLENGKMYWIDDTRHLRSANLDGTMVQTVFSATEPNHRVNCHQFDPVTNKVYWLLNEGNFDGPIMRANNDGTARETLPLSDNCPVMNAENRKLYWVFREANNEIIQRSNLDGTNIEDLVPGVDAANGLTFDHAGGKMYWYESTLTDAKIRRADIDGGTAEDLVPLPTNGSGIALNLAQQTLIWEVQGRLFSSTLSGANVASLLVGINVAGQLALDLENERIFWGDSASIRVADMDGKNAELFWENESQQSLFNFGPSRLEVDAEAGRLFWITTVFTEANNSQTATTVLLSANLDGTDVQQEGTLTLRAPYAIDLVNQRVYGFHETEDEDFSTQQFNIELSSVNFSGANRVGLGITELSSSTFVNVAVDGTGGKVYWTDGFNDTPIRQANLDGTGQSDLISDVDSPVVLAVDAQAGKLYWVSQPGGEGNVSERANLDGTERTTIVDDDVRAFAFDAEGVGTPDPDVPIDEEMNLHMPLILGE